MIIKYAQFIKETFQSMFGSGVGEFTLGNLMQVIGYSIAIVAVIVLFLALLLFSGKGPFWTYKKLITEYGIKISKAEESDMSKMIGYLKARKIGYWLVLIILYIPTIIPVILYLIHLLTTGLI